ncbi:MAG: RtcB family protein, partial [Oscillospiraceae bacterium]|nr:RtcB family protein [Oscillospiraceae bacterium]
VAKGKDGGLWLVIHSGSRHLGCEVADFYQVEGYNSLCGNAKFQLDEVIAELKAQGRDREIQSTIQSLKAQTAIPVPKELAYVEGSLFDDYIHDMKIIQRFAVLNRKAMFDTILGGTGLSAVEEFTTIHNYIDTDSMILRKGAVSAKSGEKLLIPINMRDGSLICVGKGNPDWNCSAPHGAGRLMSRNHAFRELSMEQYQSEMSGVYSTCVVPDTLDESPMAYKSMDEIISHIAPTADIIDRVKPIYNFKAAEKSVRRW